jgi:hypothetical protein
MGKNSKPILSVLVDEDKKEKFADIARRNKYSMGWLLNDCIDRMIEADSIDIYGEPARSPQSPNTNTSSIDIGDVEKMVKTSIDNLGIESMIETYVSNIGTSSIGINDVEKIVNTSIGNALNQLTEELARLETDVAELKQATSDRQVSTEPIAIPTTTPVQTAPNRPNRNGEPDWVGADTRKYYRQFVNDSELLAKVTSTIDLHPTSNKALAESLVSIGFQKADGTALDSASMSRIKKVASQLKTLEPL